MNARRALLRIGLALCLLMGWAAAAQAEQLDPEVREALRRAVHEAPSFPDRYTAEVWLTDMSARLEKRLPDAEERLELLRLVHQEATNANIKPEVVLAVIEVESNFNRFAISPVGAQGLMQVMPFWLKELGQPNDNLFDVATNLRFGCTILRYYLEMTNGDLTEALARYNGSYGRYEYAGRVYKALNRRWYAQ